MLVQHIIKKIKEDPDATSILLKTHSPEFYSKNFGFQIIRNINDSSKLMILSL